MNTSSKLQGSGLAGQEDIASNAMNGDEGWGIMETVMGHPKASHVYEGTDSESDKVVITTEDERAPSDEKLDQSAELTPPPWEYPVASHIYEGSDSDDDKVYTSSAPPATQKIVQPSHEPELYVFPQSKRPHGGIPASDIFANFQNLKLGQLADEQELFCTLGAVKKYPYTFIGAANQKRVAESFFDKNQLLEKNTWDLFYIHEKRSGTGFSNVLVLVPTRQFDQFLKTINKELGTNLDIPAGSSRAFEVAFGIPGMPHPRYLGRSTSKGMADRLQLNIPPNSYRVKGEPKDVKPTDRSLEAFRRKIELLQQSQKAKNKFKGEKKKLERVAERQQWSHSLKRVQRYLGLRETRTTPGPKPPHLNTDWEVPVVEDQIPSTVFKADEVAPFLFEGDVVFVCVDVEAYERDNNKITEIGISTLDTRDLAELHPGECGKNWIVKDGPIRSRHFRILNNKHLNNTEFIDGCADRFEFGVSEWITLDQSPGVVASCFKYPFSKPGETVPIHNDTPKRNIILVGHDVMQDVNYLRKVGYDVYNLSNLIEQVDTASMWRYLTRDPNPRNLGSILADLGITGWNLHNAGNDAAYTLQAMVGIAIKAIVDKTKSRQVLEAEKIERVSATMEEAKKSALEREAEWDSNAESDGGKPIKPTPQSVPKAEPFKFVPVASQRKKPIKVDKDNGPFTTGPWRHEKAVPGTDYWYQNDYAEKGGWAPTPIVSKGGPASWDTWEDMTRPQPKADNTPPSAPGPRNSQSQKASAGVSNKNYVPPSEHTKKQTQGHGGWGGQENFQTTTRAPTRSQPQSRSRTYVPPHLIKPAKEEPENEGWVNPGAQLPEDSLTRTMAAHHINKPSQGAHIQGSDPNRSAQEPLSRTGDDSWGNGGWGTDGTNAYDNVPARVTPLTNITKQEPEYDDEIPAGYSPGRRNSPIGEAIQANKSGPSHSQAKKSQQPPTLTSGNGNGSGYRPTAGNPVNRLERMEKIGRLDQYFVSAGVDGNQHGDGAEERYAFDANGRPW